MKRPARFFRAGVGAVVTDGRGHVLVCERADIPGAWQFPQGGLENGEAPVDAARREAEEETGIARSRLRLRRRYPGLLAYELPARAQSGFTGMGQVQYWFLFALTGTASTDIALPPGGEFTSAQWVTFDQAITRTVGFRKALYRALRDEFGPAIGAVHARPR